MTLLEMVQAVGLQAGTTQRIISLADLDTDNARYLQYVVSANSYVQLQRTDWDFLWAQTGSIVVPEGENEIIPPANLSKWDLETLRVTINGTKQALQGENYEIYRDNLQFSDTPQYPTRAIVMPNNRLQLSAPTSTAFTFSADYFMKPVQFDRVEDEDEERYSDLAESVLPTEFHEPVLISHAMMTEASYNGSTTLFARYRDLYRTNFSLLINTYTRTFGLEKNESGGSLPFSGMPLIRQ